MFKRILAFCNQDSIRTPLSIGLGSRMAVLILLIFYTGLFPIETTRKPKFLDAISTWDGNYYATIAEQGYSHDLKKGETNTAFFPLYPITGKILNFLIGNIRISLFCVSLVGFVFFLIFLYKVVELDFGQDSAERTLLYICVYPVSFIFSSNYAESLCLVLIVISFYNSRKGNWGIAILSASLASLTRIIGICVLFPLVFEIIRQKGWRTKTLLLTAIVPLCSSLYPLFLWNKFGDPFAFLNSIGKWKSEFTWPWGTIIAHVKALTDFGANTYNYSMTLINLKFLVIFFALILLSIKRLPWSYTLYAVPVFFLSTSTSIPVSEGKIPNGSIIRYLMAIFPCFILLAQLGKNLYFHYFLLFFMVIFLGVFSMFFYCTYWVC